MILTSYVLVVNTICVFEHFYVLRDMLGAGVGQSSELFLTWDVWEVVRASAASSARQMCDFGQLMGIFKLQFSPTENDIIIIYGVLIYY